MSYVPIVIPPTSRDRILAVVDRVRHPRRTRTLARATEGFRARGVVRTYGNDDAGRCLEAVEGSILWHRGYRPPTRITHNAIWWTGGPTITVAYNRELQPGFVSDRDRRIAERIGLRRR